MLFEGHRPHSLAGGGKNGIGHRRRTARKTGLANPLTVEMQVESCVAYGLSAALYGEITIERGAVVQRNFDDYPMMGMKDMPEVETHLALSGGDKWGGIGEASLPSCPPAVANAVFAATGKRMRSMPFKQHDLSS